MRLTLLCLLLAGPLWAQAPDSTRTDSTARTVYDKTVRSWFTRTVQLPGKTDTLYCSAGVCSTTRPVPPDTVVTPPPPPPPPPPTGATFFKADAESGGTLPWTQGWGIVQCKGTVSNSTAKAKSGTHSYLYEVTASGVSGCAVGAVAHDVRTMSGGPQSPMAPTTPRYLSGWYSFYSYVDAGYNDPSWNLSLGWMTGASGAPSPISHIALQKWNGVLQTIYVLKNCAVGNYPCPTIPGYTTNSGNYTMTAASPAGIKAFPRGQWVHLAVHYVMAKTNGRVEVWQDGVKTMDLTAPTMNTWGGHSQAGPNPPMTNVSNDMIIQFGNYGGVQTGPQRLYVDDFKVTDYRPAP